MRARRVLLSLTTALACSVAAGCSPFASGDETPSTTTSRSSSSPPTDRLHQVYSRGQLEDAIPTYDDLGDGWGRVGNEYLSEISDVQNIEPQECAALLLRGPTWSTLESTVVGQANRRYAKGDDDFAFVQLYSFEDPFPEAAFDEVRAATSACETWRYDGSTYTTTALTLPTYGDRSFGQRYVVTGSDTFTLESLRFAVGHTVVTISVSAPTSPDNDALRQAADSILSSLEETS